MNPPNPPPPPSPVQTFLEQIHRECSSLTDGEVATYIPELAKANPDWFGICLVTANGSVYEIGDSQQPFTIQSISKPFVYGLALEDNGRSTVMQKVGVEPTGDVFNSISLEPGSGRPRNPMINAGAIATAGLVEGVSPQGRFKRVLEAFSTYAGRPLSLDEPVFNSENETGHRNRAIGHMLRNFDILNTDPVPVVELYFKQCSISVTCRDLGVMAATLANRGINPLTTKQAIRPEYVESVLSVMGSCGMYDFAGEWIYNVGMPAKSGVSGGIIAVLPGQLGIGVFSPRLDIHGNSVRGIRVCQELTRHLDLHMLNRPGLGRSVIRLQFTGADFGSSRLRHPDEASVLHEAAKRIKIWQLQGHLTFPTTEVVVRTIMDNFDALDHVILDFRRVLSINDSGCGMLHRLLVELSARGKKLLFIQPNRVPLLRRFMKIKLGDRLEEEFRAFDDLDMALEWCEDRLVEAALPARVEDFAAALENFSVLNGLTTEELGVVKALLKRKTYPTSETIMNIGDNAKEMFLLGRGRVSVMITLPSGANKRLALFSPGMTFGEMAMIDRQPRSARIVADTDVVCSLLSLDDFDGLDQKHPGIKIKIMNNLCLDLCHRLRKANRELNVFD